MKPTQLQLKTSLSLVVSLLSLLTIAAVAIAWYSQYQAFGLLAGGAPASGQGMAGTLPQQFAWTRYVLLGLAVAAVLLGLLAYAILARAMLRPLKGVGTHFDSISAGDLTQRIDAPSDNEIGLLYLALKRMQDNLNRVIGAVRQGMAQLEAGSRLIVANNSDLSSRTEQQAATLQQTAASMEELASTVKQNADNARQANQLAATASEVAQRGGEAVGEVVSTMEGISASSHKIADIVGVIDSIAFQTNILALNAAVEAARAGEQGKGFAVVASEVRALAQRSAQAAKEIKGLIEDSVGKVAEGSAQVERAGATMQEILASVAKVTDIMGEISAATTEQSAGIDQINRAIGQMDLVTQQNAALVEQATSSASSLREQIASVNGAISVFKIAGHEVIDVAARQVPAAVQRPAVGTQAAQPKAAAPALNHGSASKPAAKDAAADIRLSKAAAPLGPSRKQVSGKLDGAAPIKLDGAREPAPSYVMQPAGAARTAAASDDDWVEF